MVSRVALALIVEVEVEDEDDMDVDVDVAAEDIVVFCVDAAISFMYAAAS